jgi:hypothetical protein
MDVVQIAGAVIAGVGSAAVLLALDSLVAGRKHRRTRLMLTRPVETWRDESVARVAARILPFRWSRSTKPGERDVPSPSAE